MEPRAASLSHTTITELMIATYANFGGKVHGGILLEGHPRQIAPLLLESRDDVRRFLEALHLFRGESESCGEVYETSDGLFPSIEAWDEAAPCE